ncbi:hypothetical protein [Variovorax terrae]|uniref:Uncharacterized protein n=1 Tax=Variovorax terrae TaxID=2923278 RepID=A0A9X2ALI5_9BURK|nr:hypothetical protein [Variovorax terrae]MCJ0762349.1 hypothetical protein [Variovorax terrae]
MADERLTPLRQALAALDSGALGAQAFSAAARSQTALLDALPARYREVLLNLLDRLESSALFSEESCSFSQKDLLDSLRLWLDKAEAQLQRG